MTKNNKPQAKQFITIPDNKLKEFFKAKKEQDQKTYQEPHQEKNKYAQKAKPVININLNDKRPLIDSTKITEEVLENMGKSAKLATPAQEALGRKGATIDTIKEEERILNIIGEAAKHSNPLQETYGEKKASVIAPSTERVYETINKAAKASHPLQMEKGKQSAMNIDNATQELEHTIKPSELKDITKQERVKLKEAEQKTLSTLEKLNSLSRVPLKVPRGNKGRAQ